MPYGKVAHLVVGVALCASACSSSKDAPPAAKSVPAANQSSSSSAATMRPETDPLWRQASTADALDLARLADREGALGLLREVETSAARRATALLALPHADDAELALRGLCQLLEKRPETAVAQAVVGIVSRPPRARERWDPSGLRSCRPVLERLSRSEAATLRDLGSSGLARLDEHL